MSVAVLQIPMSSHFDMKNNQQYCNAEDQQWSSKVDVWTAIQAQKALKSETYVHPRQTSSLMSQNSLEICTESLGSETGSEGFFDDIILSSQVQTEDQNDMEQELDIDEDEQKLRGKVLRSVNYHSSIGRRSQPRSFPPPLPSISRRDGSCIHMRPHRRDGRLVMEAVSVPSLNYLHAHREGGRLLLSFVEPVEQELPIQENEGGDISELAEIEEENDEEFDGDIEEEEEVEVVDRGNVIEVKVSTQPQQPGMAAAIGKVHRSSLFINKFVGGTPWTSPVSISDDTASVVKKAVNLNSATTAIVVASALGLNAKDYVPRMLPLCDGMSNFDKDFVGLGTKRAVASTTAASAVVVASAVSYIDEDYATRTLPLCDGESDHLIKLPSADNKLLFTSKQRNREEMLHNMIRCSELRRPLFIYEPCCIASS